MAIAYDFDLYVLWGNKLTEGSVRIRDAQCGVYTRRLTLNDSNVSIYR